MKKAALLMMVLMLILTCTAYGEEAQTTAEAMLEANSRYISLDEENISQDKRTDTAENGQHPYAVVITCSDSRVPAELIFDAGIGELFVIRTAGNVIGTYELGSIEYGAEHLQAPLVIVMGHTHCGAVDAALSGGAHGNIEAITSEIASCLPEGCTAAEAEILNVKNSIADIRTSHIMQELEQKGEVVILGAIYDIETGCVEFMTDI